MKRKVTDGYRAMSGAEGEAAIRMVVDAARRRASPFTTILKAIAA